MLIKLSGVVGTLTVSCMHIIWNDVPGVLSPRHPPRLWTPLSCSFECIWQCCVWVDLPFPLISSLSPLRPLLFSGFKGNWYLSPKKGGVSHHFICIPFSCLFSPVCVLSLSVCCVFTWIWTNDSAHFPATSFLLRTPCLLCHGYGCFPQTLYNLAWQNLLYAKPLREPSFLWLFHRLWIVYMLIEPVLRFWRCNLSSSCESTTVSLSVCSGTCWSASLFICFSACLSI